LAKNRYEVEEDPSEDEGIEAFTTKGTEAFTVKGNEAFAEEGIGSFLGKMNSTAQANQGLGGSFEQFLQKLIRLKVEIPTKEMLEQNPCCMQMSQDLVKLKKQPTTSEWVSLARDYQANTKGCTHIKIKDPGSFNVPISINGVFLGDTLCDVTRGHHQYDVY